MKIKKEEKIRKKREKVNLKTLFLKVAIIIIVILIIATIEYFKVDVTSKIQDILVKSDITYENITKIDLRQIPKYSGKPYVEINGNKPYFTEAEYTRKAFEKYSELDSLGRCGVAYANVCMAIMPTLPRERITSVRPTGWNTATYPGLVEGDLLFNRCHLIGYQLSGENANPKNLITGTRYFNVAGMLPFEDMVDNYIEAHPKNHVLYRVTPVFKGKNLVVNGVQMEGFSVEDKGKGVCFNVYVYNVQPGIEIDYATGKSHKIK